MKKVLFFMMIVSGLLFAQNEVTDESRCEIVFDNGVILKNVEVAMTKQKMAIGLAKREVIENAMIFVFPKEENLHFWMKDTLADISIGFIDENMNLFQIDEMKTATLDIHSSKQKAKYALELEKNGFEKRKVKVGNKIDSFKCK